MKNGAGHAETGTGLPSKTSYKKALLVFAALVFFVLVYHGWKALGSSQVAVLVSGELMKYAAAEGIFIWDETVIISPASGQLNLLVQEGERVRLGEDIAEIKTLSGDAFSPERTALIRASRTGVVIGSTDGLEGMLNPGQADILKLAKSKMEDENTEIGDPGKKAEKGRPVLKIVDNLSPVMGCLRVPRSEIPLSLSEKGATLKMTWGSFSFHGLVEEIEADQGMLWLVVRITSYPPSLLQQRKISLNIDSGTVTGFLIPTGSLAEKEGQTGIYMMNKHQVNWVPVKVKDIVDGQAAVTGDGLESGVRYLINPR